MNADYDIVIDGSNLINHSEKGVTKLIPSRLIKAIRKVELLGYTPLTCIDRSTYSQAKKKKKPLEGSIEDFAKLIDEEGMRFMNRDDEMIDHALQRGALILTNDRFRKWKDGTEKTKLEIDWDLVDENLVQWWFEDEFFMPELLKKSSQSSKRIGKAPINSARRLANSNSNKNIRKKKRSMFIKVLDLIFDNNKKAQKPQQKAKKQQNKTKSKPQAPKKSQAKPQQKKAKPQDQKTASKEKKPNPKQSKKSKQVKNTSSDIANFKSKILEILPERKISIAGLATIINKQMVAAGIEKNPTTEFLKQYKLPKGLKKAIVTHMSDEVIVTGTGPKFLIEKKSKADEKA
ncbi:hypothetical protein OAM96_01560 [Candidatus Poseidoniaceae archaeon]|nr:hypothetical protein [Candidatus Poseidoniaceae archaeon]